MEIVVPGTGVEPVQLAPRDFRHTTTLAAMLKTCLCAGLCLCHKNKNIFSSTPRLVSTPSLLKELGPALPRYLTHIRGFAEFEGIHQALSHLGAQSI